MVLVLNKRDENKYDPYKGRDWIKMKLCEKRKGLTRLLLLSMCLVGGQTICGVVTGKSGNRFPCK